MKLKLKDQDFELLPERAFFWHQEKLLDLSDIHLGKAFILQQAGIPVPATDSEDLHKIAQLIAICKPTRVFILGDFVHHQNSWAQQLLDDLILGNHERGSREILKLLSIHILENDVEIGPFLISHGH